MKRIVLYIATAIIGLCIIAIAFLFCKNCKASAFWECSFFNLLQLAAAIIIALFVTHFLKNRHSDNQVQKNLFLQIVSDISKILENESSVLISFMESSSHALDKRQKLLLLLKKISNKISILEQHKQEYNGKIAILMGEVRDALDSIRQAIADDPNFHEEASYSQENINKVMKSIFDIMFKLDQIKLNLFS